MPRSPLEAFEDLRKAMADLPNRMAHVLEQGRQERIEIAVRRAVRESDRAAAGQAPRLRRVARQQAGRRARIREERHERYQAGRRVTTAGMKLGHALGGPFSELASFVGRIRGIFDAFSEFKGALRARQLAQSPSPHLATPGKPAGPVPTGPAVLPPGRQGPRSPTPTPPTLPASHRPPSYAAKTPRASRRSAALPTALPRSRRGPQLPRAKPATRATPVLPRGQRGPRTPQPAPVAATPAPAPAPPPLPPRVRPRPRPTPPPLPAAAARPAPPAGGLPPPLPPALPPRLPKRPKPPPLPARLPSGLPVGYRPPPASEFEFEAPESRADLERRARSPQAPRPNLPGRGPMAFPVLPGAGAAAQPGAAGPWTGTSAGGAESAIKELIATLKDVQETMRRAQAQQPTGQRAAGPAPTAGTGKEMLGREEHASKGGAWQGVAAGLSHYTPPIAGAGGGLETLGELGQLAALLL